MHFVWCESVENFFIDKTLLRERKSVCPRFSVIILCAFIFLNYGS